MPPNAATSIANDTAGETLFGRTVHSEPTGPNTPLAKDAARQQLYPGPGDNAFIDRPSNCVAQTVAAAAGRHLPARRRQPRPRGRAPTPARPRPPGSSTIADNAIVATDAGRR